jgi:hypothetical protein
VGRASTKDGKSGTVRKEKVRVEQEGEAEVHARGTASRK